MPVVSVSLTGELLRRLEELQEEKGYSSRSEAVRDAVRDLLTRFELERFRDGKATSTITVISDHERHDVDERLIRLRHEHNEIISGDMHLHIGGRYCLEVFITEGEVEEVMSFISRIRAMRGVKQVQYTMLPLTP